MKKILIIIAITIVCLLAIFAYLAEGNVRYHYHKVITTPLAKMGVANAQYKMGEACFSDSGFDFFGEIDNKEYFDKAIYWWEKAAAKGHKKAIKALAYAKTLKESKKEE
jgi:TPR repeat protein